VRPRFVRRTFLGLASALLMTALAGPIHAKCTDSAKERAGADATEDVCVRGAASAPSGAPKDRGVPGSVVRAAELAAPGLRLSEILRAQPGVQVQDLGAFGAPSTAAIRGATAAQTPVYLGGVRLNDDVAGVADLSTVPLWMIDRVELYRAHAPLEADRLGIGGAIFVEPRRPTRPAGAVGFETGSFGARRAWTWAGFGDGRSGGLVGVSAQGATNDYPYVDDRGTLYDVSDDRIVPRTNADTRLVDGWVSGRVALGRGRVDLMVNAFGREQGAPRLALLPSRAARVAQGRVLGAVSFELPWGPDDRHALAAKTALVAARSRFDDPLYELGLGSDRLDMLGARVEQELAAALEAHRTLRLRPVLGAAHERIARLTRAATTLDASRIFARIALGVEWRPVRPLAVRGLASSECHGTFDGSGAGDACGVFAPTGRLGAELGAGPVTVLANVGRYVRVPTLGELYGVSDAVRGNGDLRPESSVNVDVGVRAATRGRGPLSAWIDAAGFARFASDLVAYARAGQGYVVPYNVGAARVVGAEAAAGVLVLRALRADLTISLLDPRDTSAERRTVSDVLPFRSMVVVSPRLRAEGRPGAAPWLGPLGAEARLVFQSARYADPAGLVVVPEQAWLDLEADAALFREKWRFRARLSNATDARRTDVIGYPLPGRAFFVSVETSL
jgi:iron complex outermembrane receptor protein